MTIPNIYATSTMLVALQGLRKAPRFLQDNIFLNMIQSQDQFIDFDVFDDDIRIAPLVSPLVEGKVMTGKGYSTTRVEPAYVKPKFQVNPNAPLVRAAGEGSTAPLTAQEREAALVAKYLTDQSDMITRRIELMCAQLLSTGKLILSGEKYPEVELDFGRDEDLTVNLETTARWGQTDVSPFDNVETWIGLVQEKSGAAVNKIRFGAGAWSKFIADPKTKEAINLHLGQENNVKLGLTSGASGQGILKGYMGHIELYLYNDSYIDEDGNTQKLFDTDSVTLVATEAAAGTIGYGAIQDPNAGFQAYPIFPKSWVQDDPGIRWIMSQAAPIVFCGRINATFHANTNVS